MSETNLYPDDSTPSILPKPPIWWRHWGLVLALLVMAAALIVVGVFVTRLFVDKTEEALNWEYIYAEVRLRCENTGGTYQPCPPCPKGSLCKPCPMPCRCLDGTGWSGVGGCVKTDSFIDTGSSMDTSDWQTYRNEEYGFEFKYPISWGAFVDSTFGENVQEITLPGKTVNMMHPNIEYHDNIYVPRLLPYGNDSADHLVKNPEDEFVNSNGVTIYYSDTSHKGSFYLNYVFENAVGKLVGLTLVTVADPSGKAAQDPDFVADRHAWLAERSPDYSDFRSTIDSIKVF